MTDTLEHLKAALADRYAIEREIGSGGMAVVYLARDLRLDRAVALKVLRPELAASLGVERFIREIEIAGKLNHPNILPLYDSGEADGLLYYAMPYVEGESLRDLLAREQQLPLDEALRITREVADALSHAHAYGVIHRDIKPENIMFQAGHAVVSDFGIARAVTEAGGEKLTQTGVAVGTPAYMSPEQAAGVGTIDARSDVYALGCLLYEMLAGEAPFTGPTAQAIMARHAMDPVPSLRT
ncbi:MAG: serine/threonine-protein kinase, partial [Planctomycetota bacterium]